MITQKKIIITISLTVFFVGLNRFVDADNATQSQQVDQSKQGMVKIQFVESEQHIAARPEPLGVAKNFLPVLVKPPEPPNEEPSEEPIKPSPKTTDVQPNAEEIGPADADVARKKDLASLKAATNKDESLSSISLSIQMKPKKSKIDMPLDRAAIEFAKHDKVEYASSYPTGQLSRSYGLATSSFCHRPLYFEQPNLERHGHNWGVLTPAVSAAHFYGTIPMLPYKMAIATQRDCVYEGSLYRPGSPAMHEINLPPLRFGPSVIEASVITGMIFLIP